MIKLFLSGVVMVCSLLRANEKSKAYNRSISLKKELCLSLERMKGMLKCSSFDVYQLCESSFTDSFKAFSDIKNNFYDNWLNACEKMRCDLDEETTELLKEMSSFLGVYDCDIQISEIDRIVGIMQKAVFDAEKDKSKVMKMNYSLSLFLGAIICLILI